MTKKEQQKARYEALVQAAFTLSDLVDVACDDAKGTLEWDDCLTDALDEYRKAEEAYYEACEE